MKKLLKSYGLERPYQYFGIVVESIINGQRKQADEQFLAMPKQYRKEFIVYIWANDQDEHLERFVDLL